MADPACTRITFPSQASCTDPATIATSMLRPRQARPARYIAPAKDTAPLLSATGKPRCPQVMVIDGNDDRGLDVGLLTTRVPSPGHLR